MQRIRKESWVSAVSFFKCKQAVYSTFEHGYMRDIQESLASAGLCFGVTFTVSIRSRHVLIMGSQDICSRTDPKAQAEDTEY